MARRTRFLGSGRDFFRRYSNRVVRTNPSEHSQASSVTKNAMFSKLMRHTPCRSAPRARRTTWAPAFQCLERAEVRSRRNSATRKSRAYDRGIGVGRLCHLPMHSRRWRQISCVARLRVNRQPSTGRANGFLRTTRFRARGPTGRQRITAVILPRLESRMGFRYSERSELEKAVQAGLTFLELRSLRRYRNMTWSELGGINRSE